MDRVSIVCVAIICGALTIRSPSTRRPWPSGDSLRAGAAQPMDSGKLLAMVDHLVYAGPDLRVATEKVERLLGVKATPGGQHPGRGTRNALIALGASSYIEIIGPDPEQPAPSLARPFGIDGLREPKLVTWSAKERDLSGRVKSAASYGVTLGAIAEGSRQRPDGLLLKWTYTDPRTVVADGLVPFFINWGTTPHPAATAAVPRLRSGRPELPSPLDRARGDGELAEPSKGGGVTLVGLKAEHPDPERIRRVLGQLGIPLQVSAGKSVSLVATIDSPRGRVELR